MTIRPGTPPAPESRGETASPSDQRRDERLSCIGLVDRVLSSWAYLLRLTLLITVIAALITTSVWLLNADLSLGPIHISPLPHTFLPR